MYHFLLGGGNGTWFCPVRLASYSSLHYTRIRELLGSLCTVVQDSQGPEGVSRDFMVHGRPNARGN